MPYEITVKSRLPATMRGQLEALLFFNSGQFRMRHAIEATIERYNKFCETGKDLDFGKPAESLHARLLKDNQQLALTTVYRNLDLLIRAGILRQTDVDDSGRAHGAHYEHVWGRAHHDHLICSACGRRVEFSYPAIDVLQEAAARANGFTLERHTLELIGLCPDCQKKDAP